MSSRPALRPFAAVLAMGVVGAFPASRLAAQIDYRNLDEGRPVQTEDAYPVERHAFELVIPYEYENEQGQVRTHLVAPELAYGIADNAMLGVALPFAALDGGAGAETEWGLGGPRLFALYNFNTESPTLPAVAVRADASFPIGDLGGDGTRVAFTAIATRSWGRTRAHLNAAVGLGADEGATGDPGVHAIPAWRASAGVDRTFLRRSLLVIGELSFREAGVESATEISLAAGARLQLTPTLVIDAGVERRLTSRAGADIGLTLGLSHAFAIAGLMPAPAR
jgi:hypothetical protein